MISCENYLTNNHTIDIRLFNRKELLNRIEFIKNFYQTTREIFLKIKQKIEYHYHDLLSERYLLGKFDYFNQRLNKVQNFDEIISIIFY